jgi:hypothetical protein
MCTVKVATDRFTSANNCPEAVTVMDCQNGHEAGGDDDSSHSEHFVNCCIRRGIKHAMAANASNGQKSRTVPATKADAIYSPQQHTAGNYSPTERE